MTGSRLREAENGAPPEPGPPGRAAPDKAVRGSNRAGEVA